MPKNLYFLICLLFLFIIPCDAQHLGVRDQVQKTYVSKIGVREATGRNDGKDVEAYLKYVWLAKGQPWCAAFVSWTFGQHGIKKPRSGGCVQLMEQGKTIFIKNKASQIPQKGDVFFIWFANKKRVAHTGFIDQWGDDIVITVEGNTNEAGSREGDGVYKKRRLKRQIYAATSYFN